MSYNVIKKYDIYTLPPETLMYKNDEFQLSELLRKKNTVKIIIVFSIFGFLYCVKP
jgi:hypothetical protein